MHMAAPKNVQQLSEKNHRWAGVVVQNPRSLGFGEAEAGGLKVLAQPRALGEK